LEYITSQDSFWKQEDDDRKKTLKKSADIKHVLEKWKLLNSTENDMLAALEILETEEDEELLGEVKIFLSSAEIIIRDFELNNLLAGPQDKCDAILSINPGAGGTESMDWASMLFRMYTRWCENNEMSYKILDFLAGEEAGIKSVTIGIEGEYVYGKLKTEVGVHRLVRLSPFDSNKRRHTSFSSVFVYPDIENEIEIEINETELRIDTFRSSGAGGQHVNTTDSAVRITHLPSGTVVSCQNERSQHKNKATAMKILKAALFEGGKRRSKSEQKRNRLGQPDSKLCFTSLSDGQRSSNRL